MPETEGPITTAIGKWMVGQHYNKRSDEFIYVPDETKMGNFHTQPSKLWFIHDFNILFTSFLIIVVALMI